MGIPEVLQVETSGSLNMMSCIAIEEVEEDMSYFLITHTSGFSITGCVSGLGRGRDQLFFDTCVLF